MQGYAFYRGLGLGVKGHRSRDLKHMVGVHLKRNPRCMFRCPLLVGAVDEGMVIRPDVGLPHPVGIAVGPWDNMRGSHIS